MECGSVDDCRGGPPGSSMMYPGMGPDNHPGNSPAALFHGGPNHPHGPPPHHPSHMTASSPMMRMPGGPPPGPPPGTAFCIGIEYFSKHECNSGFLVLYISYF